jgi:hypothetical protein
LAKFARNVVINRGVAIEEAVAKFYAHGHTKGSLADATLLIGEITITNYFQRITEVAVHFPEIHTLEIATI